MPGLNMKRFLTRGVGTESQYPIHMASSSIDGLTEYSCNCHCGRVKFTVLYPSLTHKQVVLCNCSLCSAHGLIMAHPLRKNVIFQQGEDSQATYKTAKKTMRFCAGCGMVTVFDSDKPGPEEDIGVNVRTFQGLDLEKLNYYYYDGRSINPQYEVPA